METEQNRETDRKLSDFELEEIRNELIHLEEYESGANKQEESK